MQLMLKDIPVMDIADTESGFIVKKIREPELLPVFLLNNCLTNTVNEWFKKRIIPRNREGYDREAPFFSDDSLVIELV